MAQQGASANPQPSASERITHRPRILSLLQRVRDKRLIVTVTLPGANAFFSSSVLKVDETGGFLLLDELNLPEGHKRLTQNRKFYASARLRGVNIRFTGRVDSVGESRGIAFYRVPLPDAILYEQRRSAFRVHVGMSAAIPVQIGDAEAGFADGYLSDVSLGGIGASMPTDQAQFRKGAVYQCRITIPNTPPLHTSLDVRFLKEDSPNKEVRIGGKLLDLTPAQRNDLSRFVMAMQRELMKKMPRS